MARTISRLVLATFLATAITSYGVAFADDDDDDSGSLTTGDDGTGDPASPPDDTLDTGDGDDGLTPDDTTDIDTGDTAPTPPDVSAASDGGGHDAYKMGIATEFPTGGDLAAANLLWGLSSDAYLNINFGVSFNRGIVDDPDDPRVPEPENSFGIQIGAGYRMYKPLKGKVRPYIEPFGLIAVDDFSSLGDTLRLAAGGVMGADLEVIDQFSIGIGIGAALSFSDTFDTIDFGFFTTSFEATVWW